jgi:nicotinamide-nucleotide amidase
LTASNRIDDLCKMLCDIITIGDELLIGQVNDTNSGWIAREMNSIGVRVNQFITVNDRPDHIVEAVRNALSKADIILITGGLGPTRDDLTKETLAGFFNSHLVEDNRVLKELETYFASRGRKLTDTNKKQALVPDNCQVLYNPNGTAPGMWFEKEEKVVVSMPGVPYEMKAMMKQHVIPKVISRYNLPEVFHHTIMTTGVGESFLSDIISDWETALPGYIRLAYLPSPGLVRLRLSCYNSNAAVREEILQLSKHLNTLIGNYIYGYDDVLLEEELGRLLKQNSQSLSIAESCTGGYLSHLITSVPGSSDYYIGSTISYANEVKTRILDVDPELIKSRGAVSEEVALAMVTGVRSTLGSTWSISTTGIAGPGGGSEEKPVGTVWIGISGPSGTFAKKFNFANDRIRNIQMTSMFAMNLLRMEILRQHETAGLEQNPGKENNN